MLCLWELRGEREKKEEEDCTCYRNFCDGSRTMRFFCEENGEKQGFLGDGGGLERGQKRTLGNKPQGPVIGYFILFQQKLFSADGMIVYGDHNPCHGKTPFRCWQIFVFAPCPLPFFFLFPSLFLFFIEKTKQKRSENFSPFSFIFSLKETFKKIIKKKKMPIL